jgi:hypothetical protein
MVYGAMCPGSIPGGGTQRPIAQLVEHSVEAREAQVRVLAGRRSRGVTVSFLGFHPGGRGSTPRETTEGGAHGGRTVLKTVPG